MRMNGGVSSIPRKKQHSILSFYYYYFYCYYYFCYQSASIIIVIIVLVLFLLVFVLSIIIIRLLQADLVVYLEISACCVKIKKMKCIKCM